VRRSVSRGQVDLTERGGLMATRRESGAIGILGQVSPLGDRWA
jgi:hypothetical protein